MSNRFWSSIKIYHPTDDLKDDTINPINSYTKLKNLQFTVGINEIGSFSFGIRLADVQALGTSEENGIKLNNIVKIYFGEDNTENSLRLVGIIEDINYPSSSSDNLDPIITITGRGIGSIYEDMLVLPVGLEENIIYNNTYAGVILLNQYNKATLRGFPDILQHDFTTLEDNNGDPYSVFIPYISFNVGITVADLIRQLQELAVDVTYKKGVEFWNDKGTDKSDIVNINSQISDVSYKISGKVKNIVLVKQDNSYTSVADMPSVAEFGRKETLSSTSNVDASLLANTLLDKLKSPKSSYTLSYKFNGDNFTRPFIDYDLGDTISFTLPIEEYKNSKVNSYVRAISISQDENGDFSVTPELGSPADRLTQKLEKVLNELSTGAAEGYGSEFNNNFGSTIPDTGSSTISEGEVVSYDPINQEGFVDIPFKNLENVEFTNASQKTLQGGDIVAVAQVVDPITGQKQNIVIALYPRPIGTPQENIPVGQIDINFPITGHTLPNPITLGYQDYYLFNDYTGALGLGADLIIGNSNGTVGNGGNLNAVSRVTAISSSLGAAPAGTTPNTFILQNGDLIKFKTYTYTQRDVTSGIWTDWAETSTSSIEYAYDMVNGHLFIYAVGATGGPFFLLDYTDGSITALGDMGTGVSNTTKDPLLKLIMQDNKILMQKDDGTNYYLYCSNFGANFTQSATGIGGNYMNTRIVTSENTYLYSITEVANIINTNQHNSTTGATVTVATGIDTSLVSGNNKNVLLSYKRFNSIDYFVCLTLGSEIDPGLVAARYYITLYAHNAGSTNMIYVDDANYGVGGNNAIIFGLVDNSLRFAGYYDGWGTELYSVSLV